MTHFLYFKKLLGDFESIMSFNLKNAVLLVVFGWLIWHLKIVGWSWEY